MPPDQYQSSFAEEFDRVLNATDTSLARLARLSGISLRTMENWRYGRTLRPRSSDPILTIAEILHLKRDDLNRLLLAANFESVAGMAASARPELLERLAAWLQSDAPYMAPALPAPSVIGRARELQAVLDALREYRRVVIAGMGGVGKSTLAIAAARELRDRYPDGVFWGDLRAAAPESVLESWAQALGIDVARMPDFSSRAAHLRGVFSQKEALLILDDATDGRLARQMLPATQTACAALLTTRSTGVARTITQGDERKIVTLSPLSRRASRDLLANTLGEATVQAQLPAADDLAELLGDLPLALRIAAATARSTGLSLADMVTVLDDLSSRLHRLRQDDRPLVRMAFEQSWALLDDETQDAFSATAVFEGRPFGIHAFAAVAGVQLVEGRLLLARLRERSLLNQVQAGRFALHPLLTAFALEKLPASAPAWPRFVDYYYNLLDSGENRTALVRQEMWDYAAAMRAAHALADWRRVLIFNEWLQPVWRALGHYTLARECAAMAFEAARANGEKEAEAEILYHWGVASLEQSRHAEAETHLVGALELFESVEADRRAGDAYFFLARNALARDDFQRAQETVQSAWQAYQKAEDVRGMGRALHRLAHIQFDRGQNARALELVNDAIKTQQEAGDKKEWFSSAMLGITICVQMGDLEKAAGYCRMAEALLPEIDDPVECAVFDYAAANLSRLRGHFEDALERGLKALAKFQDMHDLKSTANTFNLLAGVEAYWNKADPERRQFATGLGYCDQGLAICELIDYTLGKALLLMFQGWLLGQRGDLDSARLSWQESERLAAFMKNSWLHQRLQDLGAEFGVTRQDI